ncbi:pyridoxal kinase [Kiloniella antarctica]|uniref:pyridoxal kinase n=1 Tax=Kiloniella antarctica TaxID=1550907 RepID=A0ABW5BMN6_9PROT
MPSVISIQSYVCYGYVGNSAAVFPMQKLGVEVVSLPTTLLSNHPAHPSVYGAAVDPVLLQKLFNGIEDRGAFVNCAGILSGYLASVGNVEIIAQAVGRYKRLNSAGIYCLDPVMGDKGTGFFVNKGIPELIVERLLPLADIITPNKFEFDYITQTKTVTYAEMISAARTLINKTSLRCVVITSAEPSPDIFGDKRVPNIGVLVVTSETAHLIITPCLNVSFSGTGDLFTGLFMGWLMKGEAEEKAAQKAISALYRIIELTVQSGKEELDIITHQKCICDNDNIFPIIYCE